MDIIVFGVGEALNKRLSFLEQNYHIVFCVDNDPAKWGTTIRGYEVKSPLEVTKYNHIVVITTGQYRIEIGKQLQQMGVSKNRVYICHSYSEKNMRREEIYPCLEENLLPAEKTLINYDLYNKKEEKTKSKKVLIFCCFYSVYTKQLIENMSKRYHDIEFSLLTNAPEYKTNIFSAQLKHIYYFQTMSDLKTILSEIPVYDAMQLLWIEWYWCYFYRLIRKKAIRLNLNVGGSDFYRATESERDYKRELIACSDKVTAETLETIQEFTSYYRKDIKKDMELLPFGVLVLEYINKNKDIDKALIKEKYHIPQNKIVVTCGHNANIAHQHMEIIDALNELSEDIQKQIVCVFPMTYPNVFGSHIEAVRSRLEKVKFDNVILTEFMDFQSMAEYALISDVMIHVQTTDQLSSTMLEEMYAGSVVIAGSWLPYKSLHEMGIYFLDVDMIPDITAVLEEVVLKMDDYQEKCKRNKEIVWNHSSWDALAPKWRLLWD